MVLMHSIYINTASLQSAFPTPIITAQKIITQGIDYLVYFGWPYSQNHIRCVLETFLVRDKVGQRSIRIISSLIQCVNSSQG